MKFRFPIFILTLLLAGCSRHGDARVRKNLPGMWTISGDDVEGSHFKSTITVDPSGDYVCQMVAESRWDGVTRTSNIAGKFDVRDGLLIDTMTRNSNTNAKLPIIFSARVVRSDGQELIVKYEGTNQGGFPTNEIVFRKVKP